MPLQFSDTLRNNRANQIETTLSTSPILRIMSGPMPANCAAVDTGTMLCTMTLPSDWLSTAAVGNKTKLGTWQGTADVAAGVGTPFTSPSTLRPSWKPGTTTCQGPTVPAVV